MRVFTNLAWPDDPYRASQQLYARPSPMLAAFAVMPPGRVAFAAPAAVAVAYLPLHRTRVLTVTEDTLAFGFRAASTADADGIPGLAEAADLDLMQARRHARFLAGSALPPDLQMLREAAPGLAARGLAAVEASWADRQTHPRGRSAAVAATCASMNGSSTARGIAGDPGIAEQLAAAAAEQALAIALACARSLGRYCWAGTMGTARVMAATAWDLFPLVTWDDTSCHQPAT